MAAVTSTTTLDPRGNPEQHIEPRLLNVLDDYAIHHSPPAASDSAETPQDTILVAGTRRQRQPSAFDPSLAAHPRVSYPVANPGWWEASYRRVPDFRPLNRGLDPEERRQQIVFQVVGKVMLAGCMTVAVSWVAVCGQRVFFSNESSLWLGRGGIRWGGLRMWGWDR